MAVNIQLRHDTAANWTSANPVLMIGEAGLEIDTTKIKMGDGVTAWNSLPYFSGSPGLPDATAVGQVLISVDGSVFTPQQPVTSEEAGWLIHDDGTLVVS